MSEMIACCGLDCAVCPARVATLNHDQALRQKTAAEWSAQFKADIQAEDINCLGCHSQGPLFGHCLVCRIRACCNEKGFPTCAACPEMPCEHLAPLLDSVPGARDNLERLRS